MVVDAESVFRSLWFWLTLYVAVSYVVGVFVFRQWRITAMKYRKTAQERNSLRGDAVVASMLAPVALPLFATSVVLYGVYVFTGPVLNKWADYIGGTPEE